MKHLALILLVLLALLSLGETTLALVAPYRVASEKDWKAASDDVRENFRPGDLIVFAPSWADPVGRSFLGDLVTAEMAGRADEDRYGRIWEVSVRGGRAAETEGARQTGAWPHGRVHVALYEKAPPVELIYDFTSQLGSGRVTQAPRGGRGNERPCYHSPQDDDDGFRCAGTHVGRRTLEIDYRPRRGVLVPVDDGLITRLEFDQVPLGRTLMVHTGMHDYFSRKNANAAVHFAVFVDDAEIKTVEQSNEGGWQRWAIATGQFNGLLHRVRFEISSPAPAWRTFGFHAEVRR